jgi:hypothetical protein
MLVTKRIRQLDDVLAHFAGTGGLYVVQPATAELEARLRQLGFSHPWHSGEALLPAATFSRAAKRNANGYEIVHRDQPKETRYHQIQWTWTEFHGQDAIERTGIKDRPYYRYPRTQIPPYSIELRMHRNDIGEFLVASGPFQLADPEGRAALQNTIHLFVDLFGGCTLVRDIRVSIPAPLRRLNWEILPPGEHPFERAEAAISRVIGQSRQSAQPVLQARFAEIAAFQPTFTAVGMRGFSRYVVHGWDEQQLYLLESLEVNNATYVLSQNWEVVSAMTKAQILHSDAHEARLIHRQQWFQELRELMAANGIDRAA